MPVRKYASGFLEECESNGLPFLTTPVEGNPPIVAFKVFGPFNPSMALLEHVTITETLGAGPRLKCNVIVGSGTVFTRANFDSATVTVGTYSTTARFYRTEENIGGYTHGLLADTEKGLYISYVIIDGVSFDSYPISTYSLAPFCLEPEVGTVAVDVNNTLLAAKPIWLTEGYNYSLDYSSDDPSTIFFVVTPGVGAGLVPCNEVIEPDNIIRRINGQEANDKGEYGMKAAAADCISVDSRYDLPSNNNPKITINAHCAPCCRCQDFKDTSEYIKGVAVLYYNAVKKLQELITEYNSVSQQFKSRTECCTTFGSFTPRFRMWPQQNFKLQIQAMAENNTGHTIRAMKMKLTHVVTAANDMSAVENGNTYSIQKDQPLAVIPISEASYLYYKNLNPTSSGLTFSLGDQGVVETEVDLDTLPVPSCQLEATTDIPSCTGYLMMTSGIVIVDPIFRKIVNLNSSPGYVNVALTFTYFGSSPTPEGSPCGQAQNRIIAQNVVKRVAMSPNKQSVNPCPPATGSYVRVSLDREVSVEFSDALHGQGNLTLIYRTFVDNEWTTASTASISVNLTGQFEAQLETVPVQYIGPVQIVVKYTPPAAGQEGVFVTKCRATDASDNEVDIPAEEFEVATTVIL